MKVKIESLHSSLLLSVRTVPLDSDPNPDPDGNQNPWNQWNKQGFRAWFSRAGRTGNQPKCLPTAYKSQLITRRSQVQILPPQPKRNGHPIGWPFLFDSGGWAWRCRFRVMRPASAARWAANSTAAGGGGRENLLAQRSKKSGRRSAKIFSGTARGPKR